MALTRGDKMIILGAVVLAASVVMGLALLKKSGLVSGGAEPPSVVEPGGHGVPIPPVVAPVSPVSSSPTADSMAARPAPIAPPPASAPRPAPEPAEATQPIPAPSDLADTAAAPAVSASASRSALGGDQTLEHMFSEIAQDDAAATRAAQAKAGKTPAEEPVARPEREVPAQGPGTPVVVAGEPQPAPAPVSAPPGTEKKAHPKPATSAKAVSKAKPAVSKAKPAASKAKPAAPAKTNAHARPVAKKPARPMSPAAAAPASRGTVVRLVAEEKNGEFMLTVYTNRPPAHFQKLFVAAPPRMVLDLDGAWTYHGPMTKTTGNGFIQRIRVGRHTDKFRVVLDMGPHALSRLRGTPTVERVPEGVVLKIPN